jgi:molecular chaperone Hsp33
MDDFSLPYKIENISAHGRVVRLGPVVNEILSRHDYPEPVSRLLGEAVVLTAMLGSMLKFDGRFVMQTQSDGPVSMIVCDAKTDGTLRGHAQIDAERLAALGDAPDQTAMLGQGHIAFTVDQGVDMERYQGIVPLEADLTTAAHHYFTQSEQIQTRLVLAASPLILQGQKTQWRAGGIMIQQTAAEGGEDISAPVSEDDWHRLTALIETTEADELLDPGLAAERLIYRLYNEDGARVFEPGRFMFNCTCSRDRIERLLGTFTAEEINDMLVDGRVEVKCEFCSETYDFESAQFSA